MQQLKDVKVLTIAAMFVALGIVVSLFFKFPINSFVEIRFDTVVLAMGSQMLGPVVGAIIGILTDVGGYFVRPTGPFFPGFTISGCVSGILFGLMLYKKPVSICRVFAAKAIHTLIVGILMNSFWLSILYKAPYWATLVSRLPKEFIMLPIQAIMIFTVLKAFDAVHLNRSLGFSGGAN